MKRKIQRIHSETFTTVPMYNSATFGKQTPNVSITHFLCHHQKGSTFGNVNSLSYLKEEHTLLCLAEVILKIAPGSLKINKFFLILTEITFTPTAAICPLL